jgi:hypothetical protein
MKAILTQKVSLRMWVLTSGFKERSSLTSMSSIRVLSIFTITTASLQEIDRQLQAEKARNDALEARVLALENS